MSKKREIKRFSISITVIGLLLLAAIYYSLTNGNFSMSVMDVFRTLLFINDDPNFHKVVFEYRLPRIIVAMIVGFGLALAGAILQTITKNGLADPSIVGISSGAGAGIVIFTFLFQGVFAMDEWYSIFIRPIFGWFGGILAALIIFALSWRRGRLDIQRFILIGIAISAGFSSITLFLSLKMDPVAYSQAIVWLNGSLYSANWTYIMAIFPWLLVLIPIVFYYTKILDVIQFSEITVQSLGVHLNRSYIILLLTTIGIVSSCVAIAGNITFIGLLAPHIAKQLVGPKHKNSLLISGLVGMLLVVVADYLAKSIASEEIPLEIVIAIIGVPYFVYLLIRGKV